ncbi:hypothetical protein AB0K60_31065 [Thermopolyspora sp. NPDC052614]|uniref:hypothetical protein n=1 Tax=Thermopolyspora sp. NPDC052614 TaxID=3155682 RepID=UPI0034302A5B
MSSRNLARAGVMLGLSLAVTCAVTAAAHGVAAPAAKPTPACVNLVEHVPPKGGYSGYTLVRNRCATGRYVKVSYTNPQARVGTCLAAGRTHSFTLPWKYERYRGVKVKTISETPRTC